MAFVALVSLPVFYIDNRISHTEGGLLLLYYVLYVVFVILRASNSSALPAVTLFIAIFAPVTFIVLFVVAVCSARARRRV